MTGESSRRCLLVPIAFVVSLFAFTLIANADDVRVDAGLKLLLTFEDASSPTIGDRSGLKTVPELKFDDPARVRRQQGTLAFSSATKLMSTAPVKPLVDSLKQSDSLTVELWVKPANLTQSGPARMVSISENTSLRNFTFGQDGNKYEFRLRTTETSTNGMPSLTTPENTVKTELTHLAYTRDREGRAAMFVNGQRVAEANVLGTLDNWNDSDHLIVANERTGDRPWQGEFQLVAIYDRALSPGEIEQNFRVGTPWQNQIAKLLPPAAEQRVDFVRDVQPILRVRCFECHASGNEEGGLNLGVRARVMEGGAHGPVLTSGESRSSLIVHLVAGIDPDRRMPPEGAKLSNTEIGLIRGWIDQGAEWPAGADVLDPRSEKAKEHWAFQPLKPVAIPKSNTDRWSRTPVDQWISQALAGKGLTPSEPATPEVLIRRLSFDLIGLPPSPAEIDEFLASWEQSPDAAYEKLVDRLLASPHFGERWGRHWLDVARYADSNGQEGDQDRPGAYQYRDFVIRSFNDDRPFDQFVRWQIAGDEYEPENLDALAATGFLVAGAHTVLEDSFLEEERLRNRYNELDDMIGTLGTGMLGLTVGCARCHDHKYDAISAREYYRLLSVFHSGDRKEFQLKNGQDILVFRDFGSEPRTSWLFERGDFYDRDQQVRLGFLEVLLRGRDSVAYWETARESQPLDNSTYQRKALAEWISDVDHGAGALLARVIVNRLWQHHFGEGLVRTVNDFGVRGDPPTHPELLEWLAHDLVTNGWKLKRLHRMLVMSSVYRQSSRNDADRSAADVDNRLLWRMSPRRIEAEILRDAMLTVNNSLNRTAFGPAFKPPIAAEAMVARNLKTPYKPLEKDDPQLRRRSVYMFHKRVVPYPLFQAFDKPDAQQGCGRRDETTVAQQALALLNDNDVRDEARRFADRLQQDCGDDLSQLVPRAYRLAFGREPNAEELTISHQYLQSQTEQHTARNEPQARLNALTDYCQALFGLNEFITID